MVELLDDYRAGRIQPALVELGPMPPTARDRHRAIAGDLELRLGLMRADGDDRAVPYAYSEAVRAGHVEERARAGEVLRWLIQNGVIRGAGALKPREGKAYGTRLYLPPFERAVGLDEHSPDNWGADR